MKTLLAFIFSYNYDGLLSIAVTITYAVLSIGATIHVLLNKHDIKSSIGWIAIVFLSPFIGTICYIVFGINRVTRKAVRLRSETVDETVDESEISPSSQDNTIKVLSLQAHQMMVYSKNVYPQGFIRGNIIEPLLSGIEAYPAMLDAIKNAKKEVLLESYIFDSDSETDKFLDAFSTAIQNGVKVKVLIDGFGTLRLFRRNIEKKLAKVSGLKYGVFLPPHIPISLPFINLRNHRKLMIVDGETAFFGGMNLSASNMIPTDQKNGISDITFKIKGAVIDQIAQIFESDWAFVKKETFASCSNFVKYDNDSGALARVIPDGPDISIRRTRYIIEGALNSALKHIAIMTPYFLPDNDILSACEIAAMRGVEIEIIVPENNDHQIIAWASEANYPYLIEKGIKIYKKHGAFEHSKLFVVDQLWSLIGSANWDMRSFRLHFESTMEILDEKFARKALEIFSSKKSDSRLINLDEYKNSSILKKLRNNTLRLLTPYC
ncbi:MAG: cardiolipin synthase [Elusimicrobiota bacterium]|jgi:cardiolipin synthase|nr:cardiolipin synthase [Elusimicrobiota bacterium]